MGIQKGRCDEWDLKALNSRAERPFTPQLDILNLLDSLDRVIAEGRNSTAKWLEAYIPLVHHIEVVFTGHDDVIQKLTDAGYQVKPVYWDSFPVPTPLLVDDILYKNVHPQTDTVITQETPAPFKSWKKFFAQYDEKAKKAANAFVRQVRGQFPS